MDIEEWIDPTGELITDRWYVSSEGAGLDGSVR